MSPATLAEKSAWLALGLITELGPERMKLLVEAAGSAAAATDAPEATWRAVLGAVVGSRCRRLLPQAIQRAAQQEAAACRAGAAVVRLHEPAFPYPLEHIEYPPVTLFTMGTLEPRAKRVAVVGSRRAGPYGLRVAARIAAGLASHGVTVVSGMAYGVDAAAHRAALEAGGPTVAVLGCGVDVVYPSDHGPLHRAIRARGAVVSECPMGERPTSGAFPRRNRLISGLSMAVVVVEAPARSGSLITAAYGLTQGRQICAVPGSILDGRHAGSHALLREGAAPVESAEDVLETLREWGFGPEWRLRLPPRREPAAAPVEPRLGRVLEHLGADPVPLDALAADCRMAPAALLAALLELELAGRVQPFPGQRYARAAAPQA